MGSEEENILYARVDSLFPSLMGTVRPRDRFQNSSSKLKTTSSHPEKCFQMFLTQQHR